MEVFLVFPEDVWRLISQHVHEKCTYQSICATSEDLSYVLRHERVHILFPEVLKAVARHYERQGLGRKENRNRNDWKWISKKKLLNLRLTSRSWRRGIEQLIENEEDMLLFESEKEAKNCTIYQVGEIFQTFQEFTNFEQYFDTTHLQKNVNPFLSRAIQFVAPVNSDNVGLYIQAWFGFLEKYGYHVWFCFVGTNLQSYDDQLLIYSDILGKVLSMMPNLRVLQFRNGTFNYEKAIELKLTELYKNTQVFPNLPKLQYFSFSGIPFPTLHCILLNNQHIKTVDLTGTSTGDHLQICLKNAPNLTKMAARINSINELKNSKFAQILTRQLTNLELDVTTTGAKFSYLLRTIENSSSQSLTELTISLPSKSNAFPNGALKLPRLKVLNLRMWEAVPLDFILPLKDTLQVFSLGPLREMRFQTIILGNNFGSVIDIYHHWNYPTMSNLWTLLPKLQLFKAWKKVGNTCAWNYYCRE